MRSSKDKHIQQAVGPEVTKKHTLSKSEPTDSWFPKLEWSWMYFRANLEMEINGVWFPTHEFKIWWFLLRGDCLYKAEVRGFTGNTLRKRVCLVSHSCD